jgi:hypothetical protein
MSLSNNIDSLSINISQAFKRKYPEVDYQHYAPQFIKDYIQKSNINFKQPDGIQKIITSLTHNMNNLRNKIIHDKEKNNKSFIIDDQNIDFRKVKNQSPQQHLVAPVRIPDKINDNSRREFINSNPLIIDSSMVQYNGNGNENINTNNSSTIYLNHIQSKNSERTNNYQSFPANINNNSNNSNNQIKDNNLLSVLSNIPEEINHSDRFILMDKQKDLLKEDTNEWTYYLVIDSKDRDMNIYKSPNEYTIRFSPPSFNTKDSRSGFVDRILHNVKSIELIKCGFLDTSDLTDSSDNGNNNPPYIILEVEEFGTNHNGTNQYLNKSLAILDTFEKQDNYKYYKVMYDDKPMINKFNPRVTIDKMTIRFRLPDGKLYSFGGVNNNNTQTVNYVVFKITVLQRFLETKYLNQTDG